jgi:hypothetical protein
MFREPHRSEEDFHQEIKAHLEIEADRLVEQGMNRDEAMAAARRAFGNVTCRKSNGRRLSCATY